MANGDTPDLLTALQGPLIPANPLAQIGAALQGFSAGTQGQPNPALQQAEQEQRNRIAVAGVVMAVQRERRVKQESERQMGLDLLKLDAPPARALGAQVLIRQLRQSGITPPPGFEERLSAGHLSLDKRQEAYISILANATDDYLVDRLGIPRDMIVQLRAEAQTPAIHKMLFKKTPQQETLELLKADLDQKKYDVIVQLQNTANARFDLSQIKEDRLRAEGQARLDLEERRVVIAEGNANLAQRKFEWLTAHGPEEKRLRGLDVAEGYINQSQAAADAANKKGFLPKTSKGVIGGVLTGDTSAIEAKFKRTTDPNDPDWVNLTKTLRGSMVGFARNVEGDIGPRFKAAFDGIISLSENPPSFEALNAAYTLMRSAIKLNREGKDTAQTLFIRKPTGQTVVVPWKRGMVYDPNDIIVRIE